MGKKRIAQVGEKPVEKKEHKAPEKEEKVHVTGLKGGQRIKVVEAGPIIEETPKTTKIPDVSKKKTPKGPKPRGKKYQNARAKVDPTKNYSLPEALKLLKETSYSKFGGSAEAHLVTIKSGLRGEMELPYFQGKARKVETASEETIKKLEGGKIDFDILLSSPAMMPQLAKYAKVLGPKGLMPNPKNGTIVENPEKVAKQFEKPTLSYKTEANAPLVHLVFGKVSQPEEELKANLAALLKVIGAQNIKKLTINCTMGPGIKVELTSK